MINLRPHHRRHIPNSLAIAAAFVLIASSIAGFETGQLNEPTGRSGLHPAKTSSSETDSIGSAVENKPRNLNIGSLLFRRG